MILVPDSIPADLLPALPLPVFYFAARGPLDDSLRAAAAEASALLLFGTRRDLMHELLATMPKLRWVQTFFAGVDSVLPHLPPQCLLTNGRGLHDIAVAEHTVTLLLAGLRRMHQWRDQQQQSHWDTSAYWQNLSLGAGLTSLEGARVRILGMGSIGMAIAKLLTPFGATVEGIATSAGLRQGFVTHAVSDLDTLLPSTDALILVLPETGATKHIIGAKELALLPQRAWLVNVGRGSAIDEAALHTALAERQITGAALDVFEREPLPTDSPLWKLPNLIVSPHVAGGGRGFFPRALALLARNAELFVAGQPLENVVDLGRGY
jgi:phosphoglycerate dehydrogenase-like enzyme